MTRRLLLVLDTSSEDLPGPLVHSPRRLLDGRTVLVLGLLIDGVGSYLYLSASGRALGPDRFALVSVTWALLFLVGNGLFYPVEQELARSIASNAARGTLRLPSGGSVRQILTVAVVVTVVACTAVAVGSPLVRESLFRGETGFVAAFVVGLIGVAATLVMRGILAGTGRYVAYGAMYAADAVGKAVPALLLAAAGVDSPVVYAWVMAGSAYLGVIVALVVARPIGLPPDRTPTPWTALLSSLAFLLLTSATSLTLINLGTVAVEVLSDPSENTSAGVFLSALVIARIPLFLFQALQAVVLPRLSAAASIGDRSSFTRDVRVLVAGLGVLTVVATIAAAIAGPTVVALLFGDEFNLIDGRDMALLALASMLLTATLTLNQAQIALRRQRESWWPWAVGLVVFVAVAANLDTELLARVEWSMVWSATAAVAVASVALWRGVAELRAAPGDQDVAGATSGAGEQ